MTVQIPAGYKQTEVGVIPEDWMLVRLSSLLAAPPSYGINAPAVPYDFSLPAYIRITDISDDGKFIDKSRASVDNKASYLYKLEEGDLVFARTGASVGKSYLYQKKDGDLVYAGFLIKIKPNEKKLNPIYLSNFVKSGFYWDWVKTNSMRSGQPGINGAEYGSLPVVIPSSVEEQKTIANALSDADALIESLEQLIAKKRQIKQGAMQELLTGQRRLPGFSGEWSVIQLGDTADSRKKWTFTGGPFGSNLKSSDYVDQGVQVIQLQNIGDGYFINESEVFVEYIKADDLISCNIYPGEIILSKMGDPVARACIVPSTQSRYLMCSDGIRLAVDERKFDTYFIYMKINSREFRALANNSGTGSTRKRIGLQELRELEISCPGISEQKAIADIFKAIDEELQRLEFQLSKARQIKQGMMQELLTGRIRLIENK